MVVCHISGGIEYTDQETKIEQFSTDLKRLNTFIFSIPGEIAEEIDDPLFKMYNKIVDDLATIDVNKITTDNTLGIETTYIQNIEGFDFSETKKLDFLTLEDFTGGHRGKSIDGITYTQCVDGFADN